MLTTNQLMNRDTKTATVVVAAADSLHKELADYICPGTDDQTMIQIAVDIAGDIYFMGGNYSKSNAAGIELGSNTHLQLSDDAEIKLVDGIDANASIFKNADQVNGNDHITITGGTLEGNEENQTTGSMYGLDFVKVSASKIDMWIKGFRSYDAKLNDCGGTTLENRWFGKKWNKSECIYDGMQSITGNGNLTITFDEPKDLRNKMLTFLSDYCNTEFYFTSDGTEWQHTSITGVSLPIVSGYPLCNGYYQKMAIAPNFTSENVTNSRWRNITQIRIHYWSASPYHVGKVFLEPLPDEGLITIEFDDGCDTFHDDFAPVLAQFGYKGSVSYQTGYGDTLQKLRQLYDRGWDVTSHSVTHPHFATETQADARQEYIDSRKWLDENGLTRASFIFVFPYNETNYARYYDCLDIYTDIRTLSRYNQAMNLQTDWIQNYMSTTLEDSIFRAKKTHSWEHVIYHQGNSVADIENCCNVVKACGLKPVLYSDIYGAHKENWGQSSLCRNSGTATILQGGTAVDVPHGLGFAPSAGDVIVTPSTSLLNATEFWVDGYDAIKFTINVDGAPGAPGVPFAWAIDVL